MSLSTAKGLYMFLNYNAIYLLYMNAYIMQGFPLNEKVVKLSRICYYLSNTSKTFSLTVFRETPTTRCVKICTRTVLKFHITTVTNVHALMLDLLCFMATE